MNSALERRVDFRPAWDRRAEDPAKNYGVHGVEIHFSIVGPLGAVTWYLMTPWVLPATRAWWKTLQVPTRSEPIAGPLSWHERRETGETGEECHLVGRCKAEQIGLFNTDPLYESLVAEGIDAVWQKLETVYAEHATYRHAAQRYRLSRRDLEHGVLAGFLHPVKRWDGAPGLHAHEVAALRARFGGMSVAAAAKYAGVSRRTFLREARCCGWDGPGHAITRAIAYAVRKHQAATWQLTYAQAARRLGKDVAWVRAAIAAGVLRPLKGVDRREKVVGRKLVEQLLRKGIPELPAPLPLERGVTWIRGLEAAALAGVTFSTIKRWASIGQVRARAWIPGEGPHGARYDRASVESRARKYWREECHFKRAVPPAWLSTEAA